MGEVYKYCESYIGRMKTELLSDYESRIQFIQFELDDIFDELTKEEDEEEPEIGVPVMAVRTDIYLS